jgi:hypothetical protein
MATLKSLYSAAVVANVPSDIIAPEPPVLGSISAVQNSGVAKGRTQVTLNWAPPTLNELVGGELLGLATGAAQQVESRFDPVANGFGVYEGSGIGSTTSTTLNGAHLEGVKVLALTSAAGLSANDWLEVGGTDKEFVEILSIDGNNVTLKSRLAYDHANADTVKKVDSMVLKTVTTHYTITQATGVINLVNGAFTAGSSVVLKYQTTLQDLDHFELLRVPGNLPLGADPTFATVNADPNKVVVSSAIASGDTSYQETLTDAENGETWTYYLFSVDDEGTPNKSVADGVMVETIPTIPQNLAKTVGDAKVLLGWDDEKGDNGNGYNVYRCAGSPFVDANSIKVNSALLASADFDDSEENVTNRRPVGEVAFPANGSTYTYKVEAEDTATGWSTGTKNADSESGAAQLTASKNA